MKTKNIISVKMILSVLTLIEPLLYRIVTKTKEIIFAKSLFGQESLLMSTLILFSGNERFRHTIPTVFAQNKLYYKIIEECKVLILIEQV